MDNYITSSVGELEYVVRESYEAMRYKKHLEMQVV